MQNPAVRLATVSRTVFVVPVWVADRKGYFADEGIALAIEITNNGEKVTEHLLAGSADVSIDGPETVFINVGRGGPLRIIAGNTRKLPHFIIARPGIKTLADLRGANFGVLSLHEGTSKLIPKIAAAGGLAPGDYTVTPVGGAPTRWGLLKEGKIDVGLQPFPLSYEAEAAGFSNLGWTGTFEPDWQFTSINANGDWARRHPKLAAGFLRAVLRGQQFATAHPEDAAALAAEELRTTPALVARALGDAIRLGIFEPRLEWSEPGLSVIFHHLKADGALPADAGFDLAAYTDARYLREAQAGVPAA
jgi:ABC-type nitrate/sulfonate/bicarbonate transport system substrate-binding protein